MNKRFAMLVLGFIAFKTATAQTEKGTQNLGATFGITTSKTTYDYPDAETVNYDYKSTNYQIIPNYSYFIADKLDLNVNAGFAYTKTTNDAPNASPVEQNGKTWSASVGLRKYFLFDNKIGIRTGPYLGYSHNNANYSAFAGTNNESNTKTQTYTGGLNLDFVFYPVKNIGLAARLADLSYSHQRINNSSNPTSKANTFNFSVTNNILLSVYYVFGK
ncbi:hypothetical protein GCM10023149_31730 [Mucilaginibacter gynuensis]|uniref:Outer membrane protein beta-barrel domain-containing protein n=1 Tax=Mucilaginibacter gynuensis TaxID=1302236 RepID=A0ABP8GPB5_9SPHI